MHGLHGTGVSQSRNKLNLVDAKGQGSFPQLPILQRWFTDARFGEIMFGPYSGVSSPNTFVLNIFLPHSSRCTNSPSFFNGRFSIIKTDRDYAGMSRVSLRNLIFC